MSQKLTHNVVANGIGRLWAVLANVVFVPIYIRFLGFESYGLVVAYITLIASLQVLDAGLSPTLSRELALKIGGSTSRSQLRSARDLAHTIELIAVLVGIVVGGGLFAFSSLLAKSWFMTEHLTQQHTVDAVRLIGLIIAVQWPSVAYQSALLGLQAQIQLNAVRIATSSVQAIGAALVLWKISATIEAYFIWLLIVQVAGTLSLRRLMWHHLGGDDAEAPRFALSELAVTWRFSAGVAGLTLLASILTQTDKVILSKVVPLATFGNYGVAATVCGTLSLIAGSVYMAALPQLTGVFSHGDDIRTTDLYLRSSQLVAFLTVPAWTILAFHSHDLMILWIGDNGKALAIAMLLPLLGCGWLANALDTMPLGLQMACGWTSLSVIKNIIAVCLVVPGLFFSISHYGTIGAAAIWCALNVGYLLFEIPFMHRRLLKGALRPWYGKAVFAPVAVGGLVGWASRQITIDTNDRFYGLMTLIAIFLVVTLSVGLVLSSIRGTVFGMLGQLLGKLSRK